MTIGEYERQAARILTEARVDSPGLCARVLTSHAVRLSDVAYVLAARETMPRERATLLEQLIRRRAAGEPLAYILGQKEFYGIDFQVNASTLVPRPETEMIVDLALAMLPEHVPITFADLGCGSGCIGLALLHLRPHWRGILLDNSPQALEMAAANANRLHCNSQLILADMRTSPLAPRSLDLIVANPPYIGLQERYLVMDETLAYEPHCALFSGEGGTAHLLAAARAASSCLKPGGWALFEHGASQGEFMLSALDQMGFTAIEDKKDLAGLPRCAVVRKGDDNGGTERFQPVQY